MLVGETITATAIVCDTLFVNATSMNVPDYVFEDGYKLMSLEDLNDYISINKHLPGFPSAEDKAAWRNVSIGEYNKKLLEKLEEQTLYILQLKNVNDKLISDNKAQQRVNIEQNERIEKQDRRIDRLERLIQGRR